jgi:hypothetical protein
MSSTKNRIALKKLRELDTVWHPDSTLVFKSSTDKVVIGRWVDDQFIDLDQEAVELCEKWSFKFDTSRIEFENDENDENDEEDEEGEAEEGEAEEDEAKEGEVVEDESNEGDVDENTNEVKTEQTVSQITKPVVSEDLNGMTEEFTKNLNSYFQSVNQTFNNKISILETKLTTRNKEYDDIKELYSNIKQEHDKLKAKFDGIKSLFS